MSESTVHYGGYEICVDTKTNQYGAWVASVSLKNGAGALVEVRPMTVQPEWLTEGEALRDAVEWGSRYVDHECDARPASSSVAERLHAQSWFQLAQERARGADINERNAVMKSQN